MVKGYVIQDLFDSKFIDRDFNSKSKPDISCMFNSMTDAKDFLELNLNDCARKLDGYIFHIVQVYVSNGSMQYFTFGKYKGESFGVVSKKDPGYFIWLKENTDKVTGDLEDFYNENLEAIQERAQAKFRKYLNEECSDPLEEEDWRQF